MIVVDTPPGFQGLRDDYPVSVYSRNLPHWRQEGATYFVTFHLSDSIPAPQVKLLKEMKATWLARNPEPHDQAQRIELTIEIAYPPTREVVGCRIRILRSCS